MKLSEKKLRVRGVHELAAKFLELGSLRLEKRRLRRERLANPCVEALDIGEKPCWQRAKELDAPEGHGMPPPVVLCPACIENGQRRARERAIGLRLRALNVSATYCAQAAENIK